jgi:hypothetical protein
LLIVVCAPAIAVAALPPSSTPRSCQAAAGAVAFVPIVILVAVIVAVSVAVAAASFTYLLIVVCAPAINVAAGVFVAPRRCAVAARRWRRLPTLQLDPPWWCSFFSLSLFYDGYVS